MNRVFHAVQISTLAAWSSVSAVGFVGLWLGVPPMATLMERETPAPLSQEIQIGYAAAEAGGASAAEEAVAPASDVVVDPATAATALPDAPVQPAYDALQPLPEVPDVPVPAIQEPVSPAWQGSAAPVAAPASSAPRRSAATTGASGAASSRATRGAGQGVGSEGGGASGNGADRSRIAGGRMPAPVYPAAARRMGQTGTVLVEFTVDHSGKVIAARAKVSSSHPLLDNEAVRTVRRWKFPPGPGVMNLERPITFKLQ